MQKLPILRPWLALVCSTWPFLAAEVSAADPVVSNVRASQRAGDKWVDILYDVADADGDALTISVAVSTNGGATFEVPAVHFSGPGFGGGVSSGVNQRVVWDARADWNGNFSTSVCFRVTASDAPAPPGMVLVPTGEISMGDALKEGNSDEQPVHTVFVSAFYMDRTEVPQALWSEVYGWATNHGYAFENAGGFSKGPNHPVHTVNWYDAAKWCNARSEKLGRVPAYYTDAAQATVYRRGRVNIPLGSVKWNAGYRLPTEAEWEKAARGGSVGHRFAWGDAETISQARANYYSTWSAGQPVYAYDVNATSEYHPAFNDGIFPYTSPVGSFAANEYGLADMTGNVWEWCWDWYGAYAGASQVDPRGPASSPYAYRVLRGGGWSNGANRCRVAYRNSTGADSGGSSIGFRTVLTLDPMEATAGRHAALSNLITGDTRAPDAPIFVVPPTGQTVAAGGEANFTVTADGFPPLRYQWSKDRRALAEGGRVAGAGAPRLTLSNVNAADAGYYSVVVTNQYGAATSLGVRLTVTVGAYPILAGFWPALAGSNVWAVLVSGNLAAIAAGEAGLVLAEVSNPAAPVWLGQYDTPGSVRGVCLAGAYAYLADGPGGLVILDVSHPASPTLAGQLALGGTATGVRVAGSLAFLAAGAAGLVVVNVADPAHPSLTGACATGGGARQVFVKDNYAFVADGTNGLVVVNISNPTLPVRVGGYPAEGAGVYDVAVVQDSAYLAGGSNGVVALDVRNPAAPARAGGFAGAGEAMGLQVLGSYVYAANGPGGLTVLDFANPSAPVWVGGFVTGGEVRSVAVAQNQALVADRNYGLGVIRLDASEGRLAEILRPPADAVAARGQTAVLRVTARGTGALEFQWHKEGTPLTNNARLTGAATAELTLSGILPGDAGHYAVQIANPAGTVTSQAALLEVIWPPVITEQPQSLCVTEGNNARFQAAAAGDLPLAYQWWFNGASLEGETAPALLLSAVYHPQAGPYTLVVSNAYGRATSEVANLSVLSSPWIIRQPTNQVAPAGATVVLEVEAGGTAPLFYQWRREGLDLTNSGRISGATNALLVISGARTNDSGLYSIVVANAVGIVTNQPFNFTVFNGVGTASGLVRDGMTRAPMTNVSIRVSDADGRVVNNVATDAQGAFHLSLEAGSYRLDFSRSGYVSTFALATLETGQNRQLEAVLLAVNRPGTGVASGVVLNALTGKPLSGVLLQFRAGSGIADGPVLASRYSDGSGTYQVQLPGGTYTAEVIAEGYISARVSVVVVGGQTLNNQGMTITPRLSDEALRIVLTWGKFPYDLDSHLIGPATEGEPFHISYYDRGYTNEPPYAYLDVDEMLSYGPETVTVSEFLPGTYVYSVHDFSDSLSTTNTALADISDARVRVFQGSFEVASFNVPMGKIGTVWTVFQFEGQAKQIVPINQFSTVDTEALKDLRWFGWSTASTGARQGWAWVTVERLGGAAGSASVDFFTQDGTARANTDYTPTSDRLDFAAGESSRQIKIPIAEGPASWGKAFTISLSNPSPGWQLADRSVVSVTVEEPPRLAPAITSSPTNLTVMAGGKAVFVASATGSEPLAWQWYRRVDGVELELGAATNASLHLTGVQPAAAGPYWAVVSNALGRATSAVADLTVITAPPVVAVGQPALSNGWFQIALSSLPASGACVIWASSDLQLWTPVHTNALPAATFQFAEPVLPNRPIRFYRASIVP